MTIEELNTWITTDEGKAWLESQKKPLADKNAEILKELKTARGREAEEAQRATLAEKLLKDQAAQRAAEAAEEQKASLRAKARVLAESEGLPVGDDIDKYVGADEAGTEALVKAEAARFKSYAEGILKARFGNNAPPKNGGSAELPAIPLTQFEGMDAEAKMSFMRKGGRIKEN